MQPRSSRNKLEQLEDGSFKAWLNAPPVDGEANEALIKLVASHYKVAKSLVEIVRGHTSRNKVLRVTTPD